MKNWDKIKKVIGIPDDDIIDNDNENDVEESESGTAYETPASVREPSRTVKAPVAAARKQVNMVIVKSNDYSDARTVADHILGNRAVLLNLENCNKDMAQRILDFLSGVVYAQGGDLQRVAHSTYAVTPRNVGLQGELTDNSVEEDF